MEKPTPIGIIDTEQEEVVSVEQLVERYFPEGQDLSKEDWADINDTAYEIYDTKRKQGYGETQAPIENWRRAMRIVAIRKHLREKHKAANA